VQLLHLINAPSNATAPVLTKRTGAVVIGLQVAEVAPPVGFEPTLTAPEAVALSPELWGLCDTKGYQSQRPHGPVAGPFRHRPRGHVALACAITARETLPSRE
jgi:hypothetical protein